MKMIQDYNFKVANAVAEAFLNLAEEYVHTIEQCYSDADSYIKSLLQVEV